MPEKDNKENNKEHIAIKIPESEKSNPDVKKMMELREQLVKGDSIEVAGTGRPLSQLKGAAAQCAKKANIGGGAKKIGGGGMVEGDRRLQKYSALYEKCAERYMTGKKKIKVVVRPEEVNGKSITLQKVGRVVANPDPSSGTIPSQKTGRVVANPEPSSGTIPPVEK